MVVLLAPLKRPQSLRCRVEAVVLQEGYAEQNSRSWLMKGLDSGTSVGELGLGHWLVS